MKQSDDERLKNIWWVRQIRIDAIEECARLLDSFASIQSNSDFQAMFEGVAAAIRALKDHK